MSELAKEVARKVLAQFDEVGFCSGRLAFDAAGRLVQPTDPAATCCCLIGRIDRAMGVSIEDYEVNTARGTNLLYENEYTNAIYKALPEAERRMLWSINDGDLAWAPDPLEATRVFFERILGDEK